MTSHLLRRLARGAFVAGVALLVSVSTAQVPAERLVALDPDDARGYLRLAEELADEARSADEVRLARRLFVHAVQIGRDSSDLEQRTLGASAALALAADPAAKSERRWLLALAGALDRRFAHLVDQEDAPVLWEPAIGLAAAEALGLARSGHGREALDRLEEPGVRDVLDRITPLLGIRGGGGAAGVVERLSRGWPCPRCSNERVETRRRDGDVFRERCSVCLGNPGPRDVSAEDLAAHIRAELRLLDGDLGSWSAQLEFDRGLPLREPSIAGLQRFYGVDPLARVWRDGQWVRPEPKPSNQDQQETADEPERQAGSEPDA